MVDYETIAGHIETILQTVAGIGRIHRYDRFFTTESDFRRYHQIQSGNDTIINSCTITRGALAPAGMAPQRHGFTHVSDGESLFELRFIRGQHDDTASQIQLNRLVDAVFGVFGKDGGEAAKTLFASADLTFAPIEFTQIGIAGYGNPPFIAVNQAIAQLKVMDPT